MSIFNADGTIKQKYDSPVEISFEDGEYHVEDKVTGNIWKFCEWEDAQDFAGQIEDKYFENWCD